MKLDSVREIKSHFLQPASTFSVGIAAPERRFPSTIGLGITSDANKRLKLAVRCYGLRQRHLHNAFVYAIRKFAHGEVDVQYLDMPSAIDPMAKPGDKLANQGRCRPLNIGWSVGHYKITAGTLGCFAQRPGKKEMYILSNNHVMANSNDAKTGDKVYQPGKHDGGTDKDTVAKLSHFVRLKSDHNKVDGAIALINGDVKYDTSTLSEFGKYAGTSDGELDVGMDVRKFGRTTGATTGKITAIEMDNVRVNYGKAGVLSFDNQVEIVGQQQFSAGGDSGSLVMNSKNQGIGLLFAGGGNRTYANDLQDVLRELKIVTAK